MKACRLAIRWEIKEHVMDSHFQTWQGHWHQTCSPPKYNKTTQKQMRQLCSSNRLETQTFDPWRGESCVGMWLSAKGCTLGHSTGKWNPGGAQQSQRAEGPEIRPGELKQPENVGQRSKGDKTVRWKSA